ncbi:MAG: hypothetical protein NTW96_01915, partial [Planctomycetia bacterium]|nr:hypothetical protein [Planctomycetia bacterium]
MSVDHSEDAVEVQHDRAREFLHNLALVVDAFDPKRRPSEHHVGIPEADWKPLAYLLDLCRSWREPNDEFPYEFAAVQPTPVDSCGEVASNYHWLCWILSQRVLGQVCRALLPGAVVSDPAEAVASLEESHFVNADWREVGRAVRLESPG